ncbi:hypothetical protein, partial [Streptomyces sp. SID14436]
CTEGWAPAPGQDTPGGIPLLAAHPAACDAVAGLLGCTEGWAAAACRHDSPGAVLTARHPEPATALETLLAGA